MYVQVVCFKLAAKSDEEGFLSLSGRMLEWLQAQKGFLGYELYRGSGSWLDRLAWEDETCCKRALKEFLRTDIAAGMLPLVQEGPIAFFGEAILQASG